PSGRGDSVAGRRLGSLPQDDAREELRHEVLPREDRLLVRRKEMARVEAERLRRAVARVIVDEQEAEPESRFRSREPGPEAVPGKRDLVDGAAPIVLALDGELPLRPILVLLLVRVVLALRFVALALLLLAAVLLLVASRHGERERHELIARSESIAAVGVRVEADDEAVA